MNTHLTIRALRCWILALALFAPVAPMHAAPIRVTTWDLQPAVAASTNDGSNTSQQSLVRDAARSLKKLHPDVILLQHVPDWAACRQLAQALRPDNYEVATCSTFHDARADLPGQQIAILSKHKVFLSWSGPWEVSGQIQAAPGGYAFAAVDFEGKSIGVFSILLDDAVSPDTGKSPAPVSQQARAESARQLVKQITLVQDWKHNRPDTFIVAGDIEIPQNDLALVGGKTLPPLEALGFENAFAGLPLEKRITRPANDRETAATLDYIFTRNAGQVSRPSITKSADFEHGAVTCEMDLTAPEPAPAPTAALDRAEVPPAKPAVVPANSPPAPPSSEGSSHAWAWFGGFFAICLALFVVVRILARRPVASRELQARTAARLAPPADDPSYTHVSLDGMTQTNWRSWPPRTEAGSRAGRLPDEVRTGVIANLSRWLKQRLLQRLVSDRAQLLATQQAAALKVLAVDERLTKIEHHIQQSKQDYEQRIDQLLKELAVAREENRELIRAKIAQLKAEMEKARLSAGQHPTSPHNY